MGENCKDIQALISGYLDGELGPEDREKVERCLAEDGAFREEFEKMKRLVSAASSLRVETPPEEVWNQFLEGVYNRLERQVGWILFIIGATALGLYGGYLFLTESWGSAFVKVLVATPVVGLLIVFISVLRQRYYIAKTDRYSKEVKR